MDVTLDAVFDAPGPCATDAAGSGAAVVVVPRSTVPGDVPVAAVLRCTDDSTPS